MNHPDVEFCFNNHPLAKFENRGAFGYSANTIYVFLAEITTLNELYETIEHEALHKALSTEDFFEEQEHNAIDAIVWAKDDIYNPSEW